MKFKNILYTLLILITFSLPSMAQIQIGSDDLEDLDYAAPRKYEIGGITISGVSSFDNNMIIIASGLSIGEEILVPGEKISKAIEKLWKQNLFENIVIRATNIIDNTIFLDFYLEEKPRLSRYSFNNIKKSEADELKDFVKITRGDIVNENLLLKSTGKIKQFYADKGFLNCEVNVVQIPDTLGSVRNTMIINFIIKKGGKVKINEISIHGNEHLTENQIRAAFKNTKERSYFKPFNKLDTLFIDIFKNLFTFDKYGLYQSFEKYFTESFKLRIFKSSKYIQLDYEDDKQALLSKYNSLGYRDAKILKDSVYKSIDNTINVDIWVEEGEKYYFRDITWVGNTIYSTYQLNEMLGIRHGDTYNEKQLIENLTQNERGSDIASLYMNNGYLYFNATPVEVRVDNDSIDIEIRIYEGKQARLNKVGVKGNTKTNDHVIVRQFRTLPGDLFNRDDVQRTQRELYQLQYFNQEKFNMDWDPHPEDGTVDIEYSLEEASSDQLELSGGWGYGRFIATIGVSFNNFSLKNVFKSWAWKPIPSGDGQKLSLRFQTYGLGYFSWGFSFTEPWLGGKKPNALSLSYYSSRYRLDKVKYGDAKGGKFYVDGASIGLGKMLKWPDDYFSLYQSLNYTHYKLEDYPGIFTFTGNGTYHNIFYSIILGRSSEDSPIYPTSGSSVSLQLDLTPPYSLFSKKDYSKMSLEEKYKWIEYHKWKFKASFFQRIAGNLVLSARVRVGFLGNYNKQLGTTPFQRFSMGGDGLTGNYGYDGREVIAMRGYANESIMPAEPDPIASGGTIFNKFTLELRYPITLNQTATIYVLGFVEAGNTWNKFSMYDPYRLYKSAGLGVRVFMPMFGLLGVDWGYGFDKIPGYPGASGSQFHFSINQSID